MNNGMMSSHAQHEPQHSLHSVIGAQKLNQFGELVPKTIL